MRPKAFAATPLAPFSLSRRDPLPTDVSIDILYCGVCHSDLHQVRNEWRNTISPCIPGHKIVGPVTKVGDAVTKFQVGDLTAVGCMVDSCRTCPSCRNDLEQYCEAVPVFTDNGAPGHPLPVAAFPLIFGRRSLSGSAIGGIAETQEMQMLDFCAGHGIGCNIALIGIEQVNEAYERLLESDVKYRFVIDMASLNNFA